MAADELFPLFSLMFNVCERKLSEFRYHEEVKTRVTGTQTMNGDDCNSHNTFISWTLMGL